MMMDEEAAQRYHNILSTLEETLRREQHLINVHMLMLDALGTIGANNKTVDASLIAKECLQEANKMWEKHHAG